jgi:hypothetical protein
VFRGNSEAVSGTLSAALDHFNVMLLTDILPSDK